MARVLAIDSGPIAPDDLFRDVPRDKWHDLMLARRQFLKVRLSFDCRCLVQFVDEAEKVFADLGFANAADMVRNGYGLEPEDVAIAIEWLRLNEPTEPVPLDTARRMAQTRPALDPKGGRPKKNLAIGEVNRSANSVARIAARLKRDHPEIAAAVERGEFKSMRAAGIVAGFIKPPTPYQELHRAWTKASPEVRRRFLDEVS